MKLLFFFLISLALFARENPFEPSVVVQKSVQENIEQVVKKEKIKFKKQKNVVKKSKTQKKPSNVIWIFPKASAAMNPTNFQIWTNRKFLNQFVLVDEAKIVLDFELLENESYKTRKFQFDNNHFFGNITVGSHDDENFIRVVIEVKASIDKFSIEENNNLITIYAN